MFALALALSFIQPADACAMPRYEAPKVAKKEVKAEAAQAQAPVQPTAPATLADALAEIDGAGVIAEVPAAPAAPPADAANKQAAVGAPRS